MNKLYVIRFLIRDAFGDWLNIFTLSRWNQEDIEQAKQSFAGWTYTLAEDNDIHQIWEAR